MNNRIRLLILKKFEKDYLNLSIGLKYNTYFELFIAIMLSAKSSDIQVNRVTKKLFLKVSNSTDILKLGLNKLKNIIRTIGLFNKKTIFIM
ncbi:endonuclease III domain-containing protein [Buchnera aphidicola]|uniref:endonuclease III domain-containing protein n=1 Tax=Buchnera aphidicola TaxID=9 RepID=UPI00130D57B8|nr:hypothetical protein [Buchnera aphidicola]